MAPLIALSIIRSVYRPRRTLWKRRRGLKVTDFLPIPIDSESRYIANCAPLLLCRSFGNVRRLSSSHGLSSMNFQSLLMVRLQLPQGGSERFSLGVGNIVGQQLDVVEPQKENSLNSKSRDERVARGPVYWDMVVYVGEPGDPEDKETLAWPETRKHLRTGTLSIVQATRQPGAEREKRKESIGSAGQAIEAMGGYELTNSR